MVEEPRALDEPDEPDEPDEVLDAAVDDVLAAHEATVGTSTLFALQRPLARPMMPGRLVNTLIP